MTAMTLYQLTSQYLAIQDLADDIPPEQLQDSLDSLVDDFKVKATNVCLVAQNICALGDSLESMIEQAAARLKGIRAREAALRNYALVQMQASGITKIEGPLLKLAVQNNPARAVIDDERSLPSGMMRMPPPAPPPVPLPDKKAILDALKAGVAVPGAHLEVGVRLVIKP
jgi:hypothetical protein